MHLFVIIFLPFLFFVHHLFWCWKACRSILVWQNVILSSHLAHSFGCCYCCCSNSLNCLGRVPFPCFQQYYRYNFLSFNIVFVSSWDCCLYRLQFVRGFHFNMVLVWRLDFGIIPIIFLPSFLMSVVANCVFLHVQFAIPNFKYIYLFIYEYILFIENVYINTVPLDVCTYDRMCNAVL